MSCRRSLHLLCTPVSIAWGLLNDCFLDKESIEMDPSALALACIYVSIESVGSKDATFEPLPVIPSAEGGALPLDAVLLHIFGIDVDVFSSALELIVYTKINTENTISSECRSLLMSSSNAVNHDSTS